MNKSKIFNKIAKYFMVAMLALLPNMTMFGATENVFLTDVNKLSLNLESIMYPNSNVAYNYATLYLLDKNGQVVSLSNYKLGIWNQENSNPTTNFDGSGFKYSGDYYIFSKTQNSWGANNLFKFVISSPTLDLSGYQVIFKASNTNDFESGKENSDLTLTYQLYSQSDIDNVSFTKSTTTPSVTKTMNAIVDGQKCVVPVSSYFNDMKSALGVSTDADINNFYIRWTLVKKSDNSTITGVTASNDKLTKRTDTDFIYYVQGSALSAKDLDVTFTLPSGTSWDDVALSFVATTDLTNMSTTYGVVAQEPTPQVLYNVSCLSVSDYPFTHYEGVANKTGDWKVVNGYKYQKTYQWEYNYYVDSSDKDVLLNLPLEKYSSGGGNDLEPRGYFRWYDYNTDGTSEYLKVCDESSTKLKAMGSSGLIANNIGANPTSTLVGVNFDVTKVTENWEGTTVACDVSRYIDGLDDSKTYLLHEPTLSIRYIFHIKSRKTVADGIKNALCNSSTTGDVTYEDNKKVTFGYKDNSSVTSLRLELNDVSLYSFYPMTTEGLKKNVYDKKIEASDFNTDSYKNATGVTWRVYDAEKKIYCELQDYGNTSDVRFHNLKISELTSATWINADGTSATAPTITKGNSVYVVAYLKSSDNSMCPVANFEVRFMDFHPMTKAQIEKAGITNRLQSYLDEHYTLVTKPISFDDDDEEQTLAAPTNANDNQDRLPSKWDRRAYGFVYRDLMDYDACSTSLKGHSPGHGDFGLYKSANVSGVSDEASGYTWWAKTELHDVTYVSTNGAQSGYFLYVDASDESRQIAQADFKANLCTGMQLIFSANVADMTSAQERPQVIFKLYGMDYDADGNVKSQKLLHSFSSGDFSSNVESLNTAVWYQVYGKVVLQKDAGVENYTDFRIVIDNYCKNTNGADYAIDDIRIYQEPAKVQVIQDHPVCGSSTSTGNIKLKIRAIHETLKAITGFAENAKIYFRFVNEDGTPVTGTGYYKTVQVNTEDNKSETYTGDSYGTVNIFDSEETCKKYTIDGVSMLETDSEGETYLVLSNSYYPLELGKKYYVSISTSDPTTTTDCWGSPSAVCSIYSDWFELASQTPIITDTDGNAVTNYKISCSEADNYSVTIKGKLTTSDPVNGGTVTLDGIKFYWYLNGTSESDKLNTEASNEITISHEKLKLGETYKIYMKPEGTANADGYIPYTLNGVTYLLCTEAEPVEIRVMKDGPKMNFGFNDVSYPFNDEDYESALRIGLPQLKALKEKKGYLEVPLHSTTDGDGTVFYNTLTFLDDTNITSGDGRNVYVATTNDPLFTTEMMNTKVATLRSGELAALSANKQSTLDLKFEDDVLGKFHEGYWYELRFTFEKRGASDATTNCPGESYLKLKIVPEYVTWYPSLGVNNANWNNDANWHRSNSDELYKSDYTDYQAYQANATQKSSAAVAIPTINNYVPMKFTKVTIANLQELPFPDLGNIVTRSSNGIATKLTNVKGNVATDNIQYDIMAYWDESDQNKCLGKQADGTSLTETNDMSCEKFYGNTCHQIYFKPQAELRDQCYLVYDKAWVEKELKPNTWYTMSSPLQYIYAGDMYVPSSNGRQETEAFKDITFTDKDSESKSPYSRSLYPVYQRAWEKSGVEEITPNGNYSASHYPSDAKTGDVDLAMGYWSHVYNKVDESYAADGTFGGFSIKAGNSLLPKDKSSNALLRLPKEDKSYQYFDYESNASNSSTSVTKNDGHGKLLVAYNNEENHLAAETQSLGDGKSGFYLVANPYTCSISLKKFFEVNTELAKQAWIVEGSTVKAISSEDFSNNDYAIMPTQSFFVKKGEDATASEVKFTSAMYVDRLITSGLVVASDAAKLVTVSASDAKGNKSRVRINLNTEASENYDENEDVELFYDQNLQDIPQVYTVASSQAVAVNAVPAITWMPLGLVAESKQQVSLSVDGISKLSEPVYLYDAADETFTELHDGEDIKVEAGDHGRYFLTQTRSTTGVGHIETEQTQQVKVYSPSAGTIVVAAVGSESLDKVEVYTLEGKLMNSVKAAGKQRVTLHVATGVYAVKVTTLSASSKVNAEKVVVK